MARRKVHRPSRAHTAHGAPARRPAPRSLWRARLPRVALAIGAAAGTGQAARAQTCIWSYYPPPSQYVSRGALVYHTGMGRILLLESQTVPVVTMWSWDGSQWTHFGGFAPLPRSGVNAAYDSARDRLVVFGGADISGFPEDTWEWDGATWTRVATVGPMGRTNHGMAYDEARHKTVLFGGQRGAGTGLADTWEWDGAAWTQALVPQPPGRAVGAFAYDPVRGRTMLMGSPYPPAASLQDFWEWDGVSWVERPGPGPGREVEWMTFDRARGRVVASRYTDSNTFPLQETLELDPGAWLWTVRTPGIGLPGDAAYDAGRERTVVLDGSTYEFNGAATVVPPAALGEVTGGGSYPPGATVVLNIPAAGTDPSYQWMRGFVPIVDDGRITGATTATLTIRNAATTDSDEYLVEIRNACTNWLSGGRTYLSVAVPRCYANCDDSTTPPILNVNDFICFLNRWHAGDTYADCDHSQLPPVFSVNDFICFQVKYSQGCP